MAFKVVVSLGLWLGWLSVAVQAQEQTDHPGGVTFLRIDDATRHIMEEWPPSPLDYAVLFLNLQSQQPAVLCVASSLRWPDLEATHLQVLKKQMAPLPLLLGMELDANALIPASAEDLQGLTAISATDAPQGLPTFKGFASRPSAELCQPAQLGFTEIDFGPNIEIDDSGFTLALLARAESGEVLPSLPLLTAIRTLNVTPESIRWSSEGDLILSDAIHVPVDSRGRFHVAWNIEDRLKTLSVEALSPTSEDLPEPSDGLRRQCVVLGIDDEASQQFLVSDTANVSYAHLVALTVLALLESEKAEEPEPLVIAVTPAEPPSQPVKPEVTVRAPSHWSQGSNAGMWLLGSGLGFLCFVACVARWLRRDKQASKKSNEHKKR